MSDPATRNIETRPDMWQDPDERPAEPALDAAAEASPYSTGVDAPANGGEGVDASGLLVKLENGAGGVLAEASASTTNAQPTPILDSASHEDDKAFPTTNNAADQPIDTPALLSGAGLPLESTNATASPDTFSAQTDAVKLDQPSTQSGNGVANIQSLLGSLATAPEANGTSIASDSLFKPNQAQIFSSELPNAPIAPGVEIGSSPLSASSLGVPPSGLPPRPPPQEQPLINPNYAHSQHIRDYHPHATNSAYHPQGPASGQGNVADPNSRNYVPPVGSPGDKPQPANGVPSSSVYSPTQAAAGGQGFGSYAATPASAQAPSTPGQGTFPFRYSQSGAGSGNGASRDAGRRPEDRPWDAEVQRKYDRFLDEERRYVAEGRWEQFPQGSRLFVGEYNCLHPSRGGHAERLTLRPQETLAPRRSRSVTSSTSSTPMASSHKSLSSRRMASRSSCVLKTARMRSKRSRRRRYGIRRSVSLLDDSLQSKCLLTHGLQIWK